MKQAWFAYVHHAEIVSWKQPVVSMWIIFRA